MKSFFRNSYLNSILEVLIVMTLVLCLFGISGCQKQEDITSEDRLETAQQKIDQGFYDQALEDVDYVLAREPENARALMIKSSVYTAKAGISLKNYIDMSRINQPIPENLKNIKVNVNAVEKIYFLMQEFQWRFEAIPNLTGAAFGHIEKAVSIASQVKSPTRGQALYRLMIRTIFIRSQADAGKLLSLDRKNLCKTDSFELVMQIQRLDKSLQPWLQDWKFYNPGQADQIAKAIADLNRISMDAQEFVFSITDEQRSALCQ